MSFLRNKTTKSFWLRMVRLSLLLLTSVVALVIATYFREINDKELPLTPISQLKDEVYFFPAKKSEDAESSYQALRRFDLIFAGHEVQNTTATSNKLSNFSYIVPGKYTHVLAYIGKDLNGFAYAIEMNADFNQTFSLEMDGLHIGGKLYLYCLGDDYSKKECPKNNYMYGIKSYDFMRAKRLNPKLRDTLFRYEKQLLDIISNDLLENYAFQIPLKFDFNTALHKTIPLLDDGRKNGADCVSYFISLFEEIAHVCFDDIYMDASTLEQYYKENKLGTQAFIPKEYNFISHENLLVHELLTSLGFLLEDTSPRSTSCSDKRITTGIPTPDLLFNSPSLVDIDSSH